MIPATDSRLDLPAADQIGLVVPDMDAALAAYEPVFGPFTRMDTPLQGALYRGRRCDCELQIAFGRSGPLEFELISPVSGEGPHREFLQRGGNGLHHLRFRVEDHDVRVEACCAFGYEPIWQMQMGDIAFSYLERANDPLILELLQMPGS